MLIFDEKDVLTVSKEEYILLRSQRKGLFGLSINDLKNKHIECLCNEDILQVDGLNVTDVPILFLPFDKIKFEGIYNPQNLVSFIFGKELDNEQAINVLLNETLVFKRELNDNSNFIYSKVQLVSKINSLWYIKFPFNDVMYPICDLSPIKYKVKTVNGFRNLY